MSRAPSKISVNADAPVFGPFHADRRVDLVAALTVLALTTVLIGMSLIAFAAIFRRVVS